MSIKIYSKEYKEDIKDIWISNIILSSKETSKEYWNAIWESFLELYIEGENTIVYCDENKVKGFANFMDDGSIISIFVHNDFRREGIGSKIFDYLKEINESLNISIFEENFVAMDFCKKNSFVMKYEQFDVNTEQKEYMYEWKKYE